MTKNTALWTISAVGLLLACYALLLAGLARQWASDEDMSHGFFVLPVVGFIVWQRRSELKAIRPVPNWWGFAIAVWGGAQMLLGTLAAQVFIARTAFLVSLTGGVLFLGGARALKILASRCCCFYFCSRFQPSYTRGSRCRYRFSLRQRQRRP
jgi:Transmembrane exosortase (Exosortase_EpsH)